jgi:hypothetical protein
VLVTLTAGYIGGFVFYAIAASSLELRIDSPFEEYRDLSFDGRPWTLDADYTACSGSTILTIAAGRLERVDTGIHTALP